MKILNIKRDKNGRFIRVWDKHRIKRRCLLCSKEFEVVESRIYSGRGKYCSRECADESKKGKRFSKKTEIKKGQHLSPKTEFVYTTGAGYRHKIKDVICKDCKKRFPRTKIQIHHKDGNRKNNNLRNLIALCKSCHLKRHGKKVKK